MGIFEMLVIAVITLLVVGPERMPSAVRSVALTIGRLKRSFRNAKQEIEKQVGADEIRRQLHNEEVMQNLKATRDEMEAMLSHEHQQSERAEEASHTIGHPDHLEAATAHPDESTVDHLDAQTGREIVTPQAREPGTKPDE